MTFGTFENSRDLGTPVEIYLFVYGSGPSDFHAFTDSTRPITVEGRDYLPVPIDRTKVETNGGRDRRDMKISCSARNPILSLFHVYPPDQAISVVIRAGHADDPDKEFRAIWAGRIITVRSDGDGMGEIICRHISSASKQGGLRRNYQLGCPHVLYGGQCKAAKVQVPATVSAVGGNTLAFPPGWSGAAGAEKYVGGLVEWAVAGNNLRRTILRIRDDGVTVVLSGPPLGLAAGSVVSLVLGCNHEMSDCLGLHANIQNYGGQPFIPLVNPVNKNNY